MAHAPWLSAAAKADEALASFVANAVVAADGTKADSKVKIGASVIAGSEKGADGVGAEYLDTEDGGKAEEDATGLTKLELELLATSVINVLAELDALAVVIGISMLARVVVVEEEMATTSEEPAA